ncbi:MAG TPA: T9SS type A sorting domain-containing protein, partial [Methylomirabilota bacterium]|nr:T9SS type A sorting domain-containing protein [Methylomirabilota bacterium]
APTAEEQAALCGLAIDPTLDRFMLVGGVGLAFFDLGNRNPIESTGFDDPEGWTDLDPGHQSPMSGAGPLFFDAAEDRMLRWDGRQLWEITWPFGTPSPYGQASMSANAAGGVQVRWPGEPTLFNYVAAIDRSTDGGRTWARLKSVAPEYDGTLAFTDADASASGSRTYRATIQRAGATITLGTASTVLGSATVSTLTLAAPRPNPARDDVTLELGTPSGGTVTFELFDVSGRLAAPAVRRTVTAGVSVVTVPLARGLSPGLYMLRASDGSRQVERRLAVFR